MKSPISDVLGVLCLAFALSCGDTDPLTFVLVMGPMALVGGSARLAERGRL